MHPPPPTNKKSRSRKDTEVDGDVHDSGDRDGDNNYGRKALSGREDDYDDEDDYIVSDDDDDDNDAVEILVIVVVVVLMVVTTASCNSH